MANKDGFEPGQTLSFEDLLAMRAIAARPVGGLVAKLHPHESVVGDAGNVPQTPEVITMMPKAEVIGWLKAHGVEKPEGKVGDLRKQLIAIMFVE